MEKLYTLFSFLAIFLLAGISNPSAASIFNRKVDSIKIVFDKNQLVLPGESFNIGIISYHKKGKTRKTFGMIGGSVFWWRYKVEITGGTFKSGNIKVSEKLIPSKGKYISIKVTPKKHSGLSKTILIPLNFETEIEFRPITKFHKAPGCQFEGKIISTFNNGISRFCHDIYQSQEAKFFKLETKGLTFKKGKFTIEPNFRKIEDHTVEILTTSIRNSQLTDTFSLTLDYKHHFNLHLSGTSGFSGLQGSNGSDGFHDYHGSNGKTGENGGFGFNGPNIEIWSDLFLDSTLNCYLLYVIAENLLTGDEYRYLINPDGGSFSVSSEGGNGGSGGNGGDGGDGRKGLDGRVWYEDKVVTRTVKQARSRQVTKKVKKHKKDCRGKVIEYEVTIPTTEVYYVDVQVRELISIRHQEPGQRGGNGGHGGDAGFGGDGGSGGDIYINFTDDGWIFSNLINARSIGGMGGKHGYYGNGGNGGHGGNGSFRGKDGYIGEDGWEKIGWASNGENGKIFKETTEEFIFYQPVALNNTTQTPNHKK